MDKNNPIVQILKQINDLSGAALDGLLKGGGGKGVPAEGPEGSPAEEASESPAEERAEPPGPEDKGERPGQGGGRPFPPRR